MEDSNKQKVIDIVQRATTKDAAEYQPLFWFTENKESSCADKQHKNNICIYIEWSNDRVQTIGKTI